MPPTDTENKTTPPQSIAKDLGDRFEELFGADPILLDKSANAQLLVVPKGRAVVDLKPYLDAARPKPERRRGTSTIADVDSFVEIVDRFATSTDSAIFADPRGAKPSVTAVFDYHQAASTPESAANWLQHRAVYTPALSDEWEAWTRQNGKPMAQADFAAFVEAHITDLMVPALDDPKLKTFADLVQGAWASPSDMVALSRSLQVNVESVVRNAQTLNTGEVSIIYEEMHKDGVGQPLKVPNLFTVAIPVFYGGTLYRIAARLRYRVGGGKITWQYELVRPSLVFDDAFGGIVTTLRETGIPVFLGSPEST